MASQSARAIMWWDWLRWSLIGAALIAGGIAIATGHWQTCHVVVAQVGLNATERVCEQPSLSDTPVVAGVIAVFLLLLPDLSELTLPGGIGVKRRLEAQETMLGTQRERLQLLEQRLFQVSQAQAAATAGAVVNVGLGFDFYREMLDDAVATRVRLSELERAAASAESEPSIQFALDTKEMLAALERQAQEETTERRRDVQGEVESLTKAGRMELERELVRVWRRLATIVHLADAVRVPSDARPPDVVRRVRELGPEKTQSLIDWREAFDGAIRGVQVARRAVLLGDELEDTALASAVALARQLEASAKDLDLAG